MKTILIEGTELSGKTAIAENVKKLLIAEGYGTIHNIGAIDKKSSLVNTPLKLSEKTNSSLFREFLYTTSLINDCQPEKLYPNIDFFIQERYYPSVMAYSQVLNLFGVNRHFSKLLKRHYTSFDFNILLKISPEERAKRMSLRTNKTSLDQLIVSSPTLALDLENKLRRIMCMERNYLEIDTGKMSVMETTYKILERIL